MADEQLQALRKAEAKVARARARLEDALVERDEAIVAAAGKHSLRVISAIASTSHETVRKIIQEASEA